MSSNLIRRASVVLYPFLAAWILRLIVLTMRNKKVNFETYEKLAADDKQVIFAFWHGRLLMMPIAYRGREVTVLRSRHRDGDMMARMAGSFGVKSVKGSTSGGWIEGTKGLLRAIGDGGNIAITPDGPRGPACKAQGGIIKLARKTGLPIIPISFNCTSKKIFNSWDSFMLPHPFSKGVYIFADPIYIDKDCSNEELELKREELEESLNEITKRADNYFA